MKLILASDLSFLLEYGYALTGIPKEEMKIGYITTASKGASSTDYIKEIEKTIRQHGFNIQEFDIEGKTTEQLEKFFANKNIIHMEGGDTFYLLNAVKQGFDKVLNDLLNKGKIYIGTSAGTSIMGPSIEFSSHIPKGTSAHDLQALGFVPFLIKCHYKDDKEQEYREKLQEIKYPVRFLRDGQGILVEDGTYTFIGKGKEVILN